MVSMADRAAECAQRTGSSMRLIATALMLWQPSNGLA
jgi:hypothetical protein